MHESEKFSNHCLIDWPDKRENGPKNIFVFADDTNLMIENGLEVLEIPPKTFVRETVSVSAVTWKVTKVLFSRIYLL